MPIVKLIRAGNCRKNFCAFAPLREIVFYKKSVNYFLAYMKDAGIFLIFLAIFCSQHSSIPVQTRRMRKNSSKASLSTNRSFVSIPYKSGLQFSIKY